jgi:small subunit ribosomal protein S8
MTDPITDMFNRIKNAQAVNKETVIIPFSKVKQEIARVLKNENFIKDFTKKGRTINKRIEITISYKDDAPVMGSFKRRSKPGQRLYVGYRDLFPVKNGYGIGIVSTSKGLMSDKEVRKNKIGGELLVEVW